MAITAQTRTELVQLVVSMLGEAPSTAMLTDLVTKANAGSTIQELADHLATNAGFASSFPVWMTAAEFTKQVVDSVFAGSSVTAADKTAAIDYIAGAITAGTFTKTSAVVALTGYLASADGVANATYGSAAQVYQNKVAVAEYYTITSGQGGASAADRKAAIAGVTDAADAVTTAKASVDSDAAAAVAAAAVVPSSDATLTTKAETITGGSGDDTFTAVVTGAGASGTTLLPGDVINGGAGNDTLSISLAGDPSALSYTIAAIQTNDVETLSFNAFSTRDGANLNRTDVTLMSGLEKISILSGSAASDLRIDNAKSMLDLSMANSAGDVNMNYGGAVTSALLGPQTQNITLSNVTAGTITLPGIEVVNVTSNTLKNTVADIVMDGGTTLNISGDQNLTIGTDINFKNTTSTVVTAIDGTIDASKLTGKLNMFSTSADTMKITGGSGDDTLKMAGNLNLLDVIDGGDGIDTIQMTGAALTTQFSQVTNVEKVKFTQGTADVTADMSKLGAGVTEFTIDMKDADDVGTTVTGTISNYVDQTINIARTSADANDTNDSDGTAIAITSKTDSAADNLKVKLSAIGVDTQIIAGQSGLDLLNIASFESLNLTANASALGAKPNEIESITATNLKTAVIDGTGSLEATFVGTKLTSIDASGLAGALTLTAPASKLDVKMGQSASSVVFGTTLNASDTVTGGAGTTDKVTATVTGLTATTGAFAVTDVETLELTTSGANTLALAGVTGLKTLTVTDNKQTITGFDLADTISLGTAADASATSSEIDVTAADATGTADTLTVKLNDTAGATNSIIDATGIENLDLQVQSTNGATLDLTTFEGDAITLGVKSGVTATGAVALGTQHKNMDSLTSTYKAALTASFASASGPITFTGVGTGIQDITGGAKADTFNVGATGNITHAIAGGAGADVTNITVTAPFVNAGTLDTETINMTVAAAADNTIGTAFPVGVTAINLLGGNSLSTFTTGTLNAALKTFDASGFAGNILATVAADSLDTTVTVTGGPLATDKVIHNFATGGPYAPKLVAVETLDADVDTTMTISLAGTTGLSTIEVDSASSVLTTVSNVSSTHKVQLSDSGNAAAQLIATPVDATATDNVVNFVVKETTAIAANSKLKTTDVETVNIEMQTAESLDLSLMSMTSATKTIALNVSVNPLTPTALLTINQTPAQMTSINAAASAGVTQSNRTGTTAADYTGGLGADTFIMNNASDKIAGGGGTNDTLNISFGAVLGGISIDLAGTGEQISAMDGGALPGSVTGFENVNLSAFTGFGAVVNAVKTGSTIVGTGSNDRLTGGAGVDNITGGIGVDVMVGGAGNDIFNIAGTALAVTSSAAIDSIEGGAGTGDALNFTQGAVTIANSDVLTRINDVEKITAGPNTGVISISVTNVTLAGTEFTEIDLSGDTSATATNVVNSTGASGIATIRGGAGIEQFTFGTGASAATVNGGTGVDTYTLGANAITIDHEAGDVTTDNTIGGFTFGTDFIGLDDATMTNVSAAGALGAANYAEFVVTSNSNAAIDVINITSGANGHANILTADVFVLVDNDGTTEAFSADSIDTGLAASNAPAGAGYVLAVLEDQNSTKQFLYYDKDFAVDGGLGDIVLIGTVTSSAASAALSSFADTNFVIT
jgi:hypothetical protein